MQHRKGKKKKKRYSETGGKGRTGLKIPVSLLTKEGSKSLKITSKPLQAKDAETEESETNIQKQKCRKSSWREAPFTLPDGYRIYQGAQRLPFCCCLRFWRGECSLTWRQRCCPLQNCWRLLIQRLSPYSSALNEDQMVVFRYGFIPFILS